MRIADERGNISHQENEWRISQTFSPTAAILKGFGGLFEFARALSRRNLAVHGANADHQALYADWEAVGQYLNNAMGSAGILTQNEAECPKTINSKKSSQE